VDEEPRFAADLYRGTGAVYDKYRVPYLDEMLEDLVRRAGVAGHGRLLDLACGTGHLAFPLRRWFAEVWAVDQEPDMVEVVRAKAAAAEAGSGAAAGGEIRPVVASAETLDAEPGYFELAVIGNAFHRIDRDVVAGRVHSWLRPGGCLALCWSNGPSSGAEPWQQAIAATVARWRAALGAEHRVPENWNEPRQLRPDSQVLSEAGFEAAERHEFAAERRWTVPQIAGYVRSTSVLPDAVLAERGADFDADLTATLGPLADADGSFTQTVSFAYDLARKPNRSS
jgi:SAM-dependent methyltransferase